MKSTIKATFANIVKFKIFTFVLLMPLCAFAGEDEGEIVDQLVKRMESSLERHRELKERIRVFKEEKERFSEGEVTKRQAWRMVKAAKEVLEIITEQHAHYLFPSDYMEELAMFSSIAAKNSPARP